MKDVICIYAQRNDNDEIWEEPRAIESHYTGNTIAVSQDANGKLSYDFSGVADVLTTVCLDAFFRAIGVQMGIKHKIWEYQKICGQIPSLN